MILGKVVGNIVSTLKHPVYANKKLMMVQPLTHTGEPSGTLMLAVDTVGAGAGEIVLVSADGKAAGEILELPARSPIRSIIIGIVDRLET